MFSFDDQALYSATQPGRVAIEQEGGGRPETKRAPLAAGRAPAGSSDAGMRTVVLLGDAQRGVAAGEQPLRTERYHTGIVIGHTFKGAWRYLEHDWVSRSGGIVYEIAGSADTPESCGDEEVEVFS
jgi:hypothetical protein